MSRFEPLFESFRNLESEPISRREFFRKGLSLSAAAAGAFMLSRARPVFAQNWRTPSGDYDLVALVNGTPGGMFDRGIAALGGMKRFVRRGDTVVIKPNMSWHAEPEQAANTNPELVARIVEHCLAAGAGKVYIFDHVLSRNSYTVSGIQQAAENAGAQAVPGGADRYYQSVKLPKAKLLIQTRVHELLLEADAFINVPVLKHHGSTNMTLAMKNLMGCVWDRGYYHRYGLDQCIADFITLKKPTLNVVDAYRVMINGGPSGRGHAKVLTKRMQIISPDIVAADAAAAAQGAQWGVYGAERVGYIGIADRMGLGRSDLENLNIKKIML
ncbi:MAG: DUF362 domain-containing protein [Spirochaetales bacterium]|nr:DUF362 domain-containing protein [Spirochaetales bacterium]MCF7938891.1 DUF362 domain-containing protein [Spirochaetales bacterium]